MSTYFVPKRLASSVEGFCDLLCLLIAFMFITVSLIVGSIVDLQCFSTIFQFTEMLYCCAEREWFNI